MNELTENLFCKSKPALLEALKAYAKEEFGVELMERNYKGCQKYEDLMKENMCSDCDKEASRQCAICGDYYCNYCFGEDVICKWCKDEEIEQW